MKIAQTVTTVAPAQNCSGLARGCTFKTRVTVTHVSGQEHPVYSCEGTPTDCVRVALMSGIATRVDVVVSGINHGANLGDDVNYSGTVAAGLEARLLGVSALCVSQQSPTGSFAFNDESNAANELGYDFTQSAPAAAAFARIVAAARPTQPLVLNVNFPARSAAPITDLTRLAKRSYALGSLEPAFAQGSTRQYYVFGRPDDPHSSEFEALPGTDVAALLLGHVSITPLSLDARTVGELPEDQQSMSALIERLAICGG